MDNLPFPTSIPIENKPDQSHGSIVVTNEGARQTEEIEMKPLNRPINQAIQTYRSYVHMPPDCCPRMVSKHFDRFKYMIPESIQLQWTYLRSRAHRLVEHRFFEWLIIASILASSTTLVS